MKVSVSCVGASASQITQPFLPVGLNLLRDKLNHIDSSTVSGNMAAYAPMLVIRSYLYNTCPYRIFMWIDDFVDAAFYYQISYNWMIMPAARTKVFY